MVGTILAQIVVAAALGAAVGAEREINSRPAGLRTHMLVCVGAAIFTLVGAQIGGTDPTRIAAGVVTGIGFIGGGAIVREGITARGLTTAASLWVTAAIGVAIGLRAWSAGVIGTVTALVVLYVVRMMEHTLPRRHRFDITLTLAAGAKLDNVEAVVREALPRAEIEQVTFGPAGQALTLAAVPPKRASVAQVGERLRSLPGVLGAEVTRGA
jgi:putative Mg2+ transporter-C (MgtC) family protein